MLPQHLRLSALRALPKIAAATEAGQAPVVPTARRNVATRAAWQLVAHAVAGACCGWLVLGGLLATDAVGLRTLLANAEDGPLALILLLLQFGAGFATFALGTAFAMPGRTKRHG